MPFDSRPDAKRNFSVVGTRPLRPDGIDKVTGRAKFGADATAPGMLVGRILRSPHAHARIRKIDVSKAEKLAGVKAVVTRDDFPDHTDGDGALYDVLYNIMAREKALYEGHAVAAVAAVNARVAREALKLIKIDYEILPHVTDVDEAMKPGAPVLHSTIFTDGVEPKPKKPSNIVRRYEFGHGDVEAGFKKADIIVKRILQDRGDASGLYRAPCLPRQCVTGRPGGIVGLHPGPFHGARHLRAPARLGHLQAARHRLGDRRRLRRQDHGVHRAGRARSVAQGQPPGQGRHEPRRSLQGHRPDSEHLGRRQDRRHQGRPDHRRRRDPALSGRRLCGFAGGVRRHVGLRLLRPRECAGDRL